MVKYKRGNKRYGYMAGQTKPRKYHSKGVKSKMLLSYTVPRSTSLTGYCVETANGKRCNVRKISQKVRLFNDGRCKYTPYKRGGRGVLVCKSTGRKFYLKKPISEARRAQLAEQLVGARAAKAAKGAPAAAPSSSSSSSSSSGGRRKRRRSMSSVPAVSLPARKRNKPDYFA